jgi:hypothetical protein
LLTAWQQTEFSDGQDDPYLLHVRRHQPRYTLDAVRAGHTHHLTISPSWHASRAQCARRRDNSKTSRTVGLAPHKTSCRLFKLRFPGSSYQRACDPHHIENLDFGRWVKENDSGWATFLLTFFCSAFNAILPRYTLICCLHEASCPPQLPFFVPTSLYLESAVEGDTPPKLYLRGDYDALRWYLRKPRAL